jgi:hypothetical protein
VDVRFANHLPHQYDRWKAEDLPHAKSTDWNHRELSRVLVEWPAQLVFSCHLCRYYVSAAFVLSLFLPENGKALRGRRLENEAYH